MQNRIKSLILCVIMCITLATPITLHVSQHNVPEVSPQEQHLIIQEYNCITEVLHYEARSEGLVGLTAVLSVVSNRKNHKLYPSTYCGVIQQKYQFSYRNHLQKGQIMPRSKLSYNALEHKVATQVSTLAFEAAVGSFKPILEPSVVMYHSIKMKTYPNWSKKFKKYAIIRSHIFYRS